MANIISFIRMFGGFIVIGLLLKKFYWWAFILYVLLGFSDMLDGFVARVNNEVSQFGKILDPTADKIFVFVISVYFVWEHLLAWWFVAILLLREFFVLSLRIIAVSRRKDVASVFSAKLKTAFNLVLLGQILFNLALRKSEVSNVVKNNILFKITFLVASLQNYFYWITLILVIYSFFVYLKEYLGSLSGEQL